MRRRRVLSDHGGAGCRVDARLSEDDRAVYATNSTTSAEGGANGQKWLNSDEDGYGAVGVGVLAGHQRVRQASQTRNWASATESRWLAWLAWLASKHQGGRATRHM
jgi:hypothetical protein